MARKKDKTHILSYGSDGIKIDNVVIYSGQVETELVGGNKYIVPKDTARIFKRVKPQLKNIKTVSLLDSEDKMFIRFLGGEYQFYKKYWEEVEPPEKKEEVFTLPIPEAFIKRIKKLDQRQQKLIIQLLLYQDDNDVRMFVTDGRVAYVYRFPEADAKAIKQVAKEEMYVTIKDTYDPKITFNTPWTLKTVKEQDGAETQKLYVEGTSSSDFLVDYLNELTSAFESTQDIKIAESDIKLMKKHKDGRRYEFYKDKFNIYFEEYDSPYSSIEVESEEPGATGELTYPIDSELKMGFSEKIFKHIALSKLNKVTICRGNVTYGGGNDQFILYVKDSVCEAYIAPLIN